MVADEYKVTYHQNAYLREYGLENQLYVIFSVVSITRWSVTFHFQEYGLNVRPPLRMEF
jgi:hypothetical protein